MICEKCIHKNVCKYGELRSDGIYCTGEKCKQFKDKTNCLELPCDIGDTFYGVNEISYDAYCVYGFKWGKRRGDDENVLIVLTTYDMEFVWGEEAFINEEEAKTYLDNVIKD